MTHRDPTETHCAGCGIPLSDGYVIGCDQCSNRRQGRLRRGELFTPTGYAGEAINNRTGRIIASGGLALGAAVRALLAGRQSLGREQPPGAQVKHGDPTGINPDIWLGNDPDLALVTADMHEWLVAHPCECEALCECDGEGDDA